MAQQKNISIDQGETYSIDINITDQYDDLIDLTGYTANSQIRKHYLSESYVSFTTSVANNGVVTLSLTANQTANITAGRYYYDLLISADDGHKTRVIEGICTVKAGVTR